MVAHPKPADRYQRFTATGPGAAIARRLDLPRPATLRRQRPGDPAVLGPVEFGPPDGPLLPVLRDIVQHAATAPTAPGTPTAPTAPAGAGAPAGPGAPAGSTGSDTGDPAAVVFDATGVDEPAGLRGLYEYLHPRVRRLRRGGRVVVVGARPEPDDPPGRHVAQRALVGFVRSLGKELGGRGTTVTLLRAAPGADLGSTVRFLLSYRSAFVSGQVVDVGAGGGAAGDHARPLAGRTALVTGAAQGIGAAIADTLARDGARVVCLDVPAQGESLSTVANRVGGTAVQLDITAAGAAGRLADHLTQRYGGVDVVVHNAGVLRDRTLARMSEAEWDTVLAVNLDAQCAITDRLLADGVLGERPRIVCLSSLNGIAGAAGQTNYATSKAGVIGLVEAYAPVLARHGGTVNAVAPGFIETRMTATMPALPRQFGRRLSALAQGGLPVDVAETVAWLAAPGSGGITGQTVRVCGQNFLGA